MSILSAPDLFTVLHLNYIKSGHEKSRNPEKTARLNVAIPTIPDILPLPGLKKIEKIEKKVVDIPKRMRIIVLEGGEKTTPKNNDIPERMNKPKHEPKHEPKQEDRKMKKNITVSRGNKKLISTNKTRFLIWNLPACKTCPFATPLCRLFCYARKAEKQYPDCLPCRTRNLKSSKRKNFVAEMIKELEYHIGCPSYRKAEKIVVRIHESGDFYSKEYTKKWLEIARHFKDNKKVVFMAYTKSVEFFKGEEIPENMVVRFSLWDDTDMKQAMLAALMGLPIYTAVEKFTDEPKIERCSCVDCGTCGKCWNKNIKTLKCEIH